MRLGCKRVGDSAGDILGDGTGGGGDLEIQYPPFLPDRDREQKDSPEIGA